MIDTAPTPQYPKISGVRNTFQGSSKQNSQMPPIPDPDATEKSFRSKRKKHANLKVILGSFVFMLVLFAGIGGVFLTTNQQSTDTRSQASAQKVPQFGTTGLQQQGGYSFTDLQFDASQVDPQIKISHIEATVNVMWSYGEEKVLGVSDSEVAMIMEEIGDRSPSDRGPGDIHRDQDSGSRSSKGCIPGVPNMCPEGYDCVDAGIVCPPNVPDCVVRSGMSPGRCERILEKSNHEESDLEEGEVTGDPREEMKNDRKDVMYCDRDPNVCPEGYSCFSGSGKPGTAFAIRPYCKKDMPQPTSSVRPSPSPNTSVIQGDTLYRGSQGRVISKVGKDLLSVSLVEKPDSRQESLGYTIKVRAQVPSNVSQSSLRQRFAVIRIVAPEGARLEKVTLADEKVMGYLPDAPGTAVNLLSLVDDRDDNDDGKEESEKDDKENEDTENTEDTRPAESPTPQLRGCPEDLRVCPDGTKLQRIAPSCQFPECPPAGGCPEDLRLCPDGTRLTRVGPNCEFPECPMDGAVCGNMVCEEGEADFEDCPPCEDSRFCSMRACILKPGTCPADCGQTDSDISNKGDCVIAGCNGELCIDREQAKLMGNTICRAKPEYACYKTATCEVQKNGQCGFTMTDELTQCLATKKGNSVQLKTPQPLDSGSEASQLEKQNDSYSTAQDSVVTQESNEVTESPELLSAKNAWQTAVRNREAAENKVKNSQQSFRSTSSFNMYRKINTFRQLRSAQQQLQRALQAEVQAENRYLDLKASLR